MKKILLLLLTLIPLFLSAQKKETKEKFKTYTETEYYKIDGNNVVVSEVINDIPGTKDEIYIKVKNYFARNYVDANSVLQTDDKEAGVVIAKGYYREFYRCGYMGLQSIQWNAYHILRVDIKDGRIRILCSVHTMDYVLDASNPIKKYSYNIVDAAPITDKREIDKGKQMDAFINLIDKMHDSIDELEKSIKEGSISGENEDW